MTEEQNTTNDLSTVKIRRKKTMSEAALAANRANAKKCTGPKTREGKFKSSLNALKHGAYSHNFILKSEDAATFENLSKSFIDEFQPASPFELELLKQLISAAWRRNRINEAIDATIAATPLPLPAAEITLPAFEKLENEKPSFARQEAHEFSLINLFQRTLSRLNAIRDKKITNETKFARDRFAFAA